MQNIDVMDNIGIKITHFTSLSKTIGILRKYRNDSMSTIKSDIESSDFVFACDYTDDEGLVKLINCYDELVACGCNVVIYDLGRIGSRELLCNLHESHEITHMETLAEIDAELNDAENDE
ncbi:MAG: hypothetical protein IKD90_11285 [Clostridiales bacterium]|nr:hypothetical protein [Clostridiales bacterium]